LLDCPLLWLKFGPELPFGFKPVTDIVTMLGAARNVDFKSAVGDLEVVGSRFIRVTFAITTPSE